MSCALQSTFKDFAGNGVMKVRGVMQQMLGVVRMLERLRGSAHMLWRCFV